MSFLWQRLLLSRTCKPMAVALSSRPASILSLHSTRTFGSMYSSNILMMAQKSPASKPQSPSEENNKRGGPSAKKKNQGLMGGSEGNSISRRLLLIRRVAHVNSGGKLRSISALVILGNGNGAGGYGIGRAPDVASAIQKATKIAEKNMVYIDRFDRRTIYSDMDHKFLNVRLRMRTAPPGEFLIPIFEKSKTRIFKKTET